MSFDCFLFSSLFFLLSQWLLFILNIRIYIFMKLIKNIIKLFKLFYFLLYKVNYYFLKQISSPGKYNDKYIYIYICAYTKLIGKLK
jgi:hypothetical protein